MGIEGIKEYQGNFDLLALPKTAFLCSRKIPASAVLKCYDWAIQQREEGRCIISGFHSQLEKDVLHYLLKGNQPIILVLGRGMMTKLEPSFLRHIENNRLIIITPFDIRVKRVTEETALVRNKLMLDLADSVTIGHLSKTSNLSQLLDDTIKPVTYL